MKVVILHDALPPDARPDELDVLVQAECVKEALHRLGHACTALPLGLDLERSAAGLRESAPDPVFNLVESVGGTGRLIHLAPSLLDHLRIPYTGARAEAMFLTSNKLLAKQILATHGIDTPAWLRANASQSHDGKKAIARGREEPLPNGRGSDIPRGSDMPHGDDRVPRSEGSERHDGALAAAYIIKSVWEEASLGLDDDAVFRPGSFEELAREVGMRAERLGGEAFAEAFVEGREFNLALLAGPDGPELLPPAEIRFVDYPADRPRIVGYKAKWQEDSHEYNNTPRTFDFPAADATLLDALCDVARRCWDTLGLAGYARVDFRVDSDGRPWVLEVNANPCLSPDAGFMAAARQAGLDMTGVVRRLVDGALL